MNMKQLYVKQLFVGLALIAGSAMASGRGTTVTTGSGDYNVDTVFHAKVGPGTTQTQLRLTGATYNLDVFYLTVDQRAPGVSIRTLSGADKLAGNATTSSMAIKHSHDGLHYFAGSNGDFYFTGGNASNGTSLVGTPVCAFAVDREIFRTSESSYQFSVDIEGVARICRLSFQNGTVSHGDVTVPFKTINTDAQDNSVTLFTSKYYGTSNHPGLAGNCSEVTARLVEGDDFLAGCSYRMEVTSEPTRTGDIAIPDGGFVILGRGTADQFVAGLKPGDIVTFDNITVTPEGDRIIPSCIMSGNPKNVGGGVNLNSESERGDASQRHPRTGIGISADGNTIVMMVVDGRSASSAGCTTGTLGDLLMFAGCAEGVNLDGGGSSTLYTEALGVRNDCSDSRERAVANAIYAVLEAPEDNEVAEICFYDYNPEMPYLGIYVPRVIAFNKHGLAIDTDYKDYTLSCGNGLGEITADGRGVFITGRGMHAITATAGNLSVSMPVTVADASEATLVSPSVIVDDTHPYQIELYSTVRGNHVELNAAALTWKSSDESIATVDANGTVHAVANGSTTIIGTLGDLVIEQAVVVENHASAWQPLFDMTAMPGWKQLKGDITGLEVTPGTEGFGVDFTISKTRNPRVQLNITDATTYGIPEALDIDINAGNTVLSRVTLSVLPANSDDQTAMVAENVTGTTRVRYMLKDYFGEDCQTIFPLQLKSLLFNFGNAVGETCHFDVTSMWANYDITQGVSNVSADASPLAVIVRGGEALLSTPARSIIVADLSGRIVATGSGTSIALPAGHGIALMTVDGVTVKVAY